MWIGGEGRRSFRIEKSQERLGWLDMGQMAAKSTILLAMKEIEESQEGLLEKEENSVRRPGGGREGRMRRILRRTEVIDEW